jgi:glycosyltransferase involved in cell wall biosynthesis
MGGIPIAVELARAGIEVTLILLHHDYDTYDHNSRTAHLPEDVRHMVHIIYAGQMLVKKRRWRKSYFSLPRLISVALKSTASLKRALAENPADAVILYKAQPHVVLAGLYAKRKLCVPTVLMVDDLESESNNIRSRWMKAVLRRYEKKAARSFDAVIAHTRFLAAHFTRLRRNDRDVHFIPPGVEPWRFEDVPREPHRFRRKVLYFGSMSPKSGQRVDLLLEAFRQVVAEIPDARLILAGAGDVVEIENMLGKMDLRRNVSYIGPFELSELPRLVAACDVVADPVDASPANQAKCSTRVRYGMFLGRPVVTGDVGDRAWMLGRGGIAVEPGDTGALATALTHLLMSPDAARGMAREGGERIKQFYWSNVINNYTEILEKISGRKLPERKPVPGVRVVGDIVRV